MPGNKQRLDKFFIIPQNDAQPTSQTNMLMKELSKRLEIMQVQGIIKGWETEEQLPSGRSVK